MAAERVDYYSDEEFEQAQMAEEQERGEWEAEEEAKFKQAEEKYWYECEKAEEEADLQEQNATDTQKVE